MYLLLGNYLNLHLHLGGHYSRLDTKNKLSILSIRKLRCNKFRNNWDQFQRMLYETINQSYLVVNL